MEQLLLVIPALACPIGMGVCMWMMGKHMRSSDKKAKPESVESTTDQSATDQDVEQVPPSRDLSRI